VNLSTLNFDRSVAHLPYRVPKSIDVVPGLPDVWWGNDERVESGLIYSQTLFGPSIINTLIRLPNYLLYLGRRDAISSDLSTITYEWESTSLTADERRHSPQWRHAPPPITL